jgi:hypothetical protein
MKREQEYKKLADNVLKRAADEQNAQLKAEWEILAARYLELASQSKKIEENDTLFDPIPWDRLRRR